MAEGDCHIYTTKNAGAKRTLLRRLVGVARLELAASWSRTMRATICATPRDSFIIIMSFWPVVKELFHFLHICGLVQIYCQHEDEIWIQL